MPRGWHRRRLAAVEIRPIDESEFGAFVQTMTYAFGEDVDPDSDERFRAIIEWDRTVAAFDGAELVGTAGAFSYELTVPGGVVPMGGTTVVAVRPTHRRRGVLNAMMTYHLEEVRRRGEPVAGLWASESSIYDRYGYGLATYRAEIEIERARAQFRDEGNPTGNLRLLETEDALKVLPSFYEAVRRRRPGMLSRSAAWWEHRVTSDPERWRNGMTAQRYVVYEDAGEAYGYVIYRQKSEWQEGNYGGRVEVVELVPGNRMAHRALWQYLLGIDLSVTVSAWNMPADETLSAQITDPRRVKTKLLDALWLRILDVPAALTARHYRVPGELVLAVRDQLAGGTFRLEAHGNGAEVVPADTEPDLSLGVAELSAIYLGGVAPARLARAGRIDGSPEAVELASVMFSWDRAPWCQEVF